MENNQEVTQEDIERLKKEHLNYKENEYGIKLWYENIQFDTIEEIIAMVKANEDAKLDLFLEDFFVLDDFADHLKKYTDLRQKAIDIWYSVKPITAKEALSKYANNAERRYLVMSKMDPTQILKDVEAVLVDSQTVKKTQKKTVFKDGRNEHDKLNYKNVKPDDIEVQEFTYEDTYELYKTTPEQIAIEKTTNAWSGEETPNEVYFVKCKDASSDRVYYLFVEKTTDAIEAIASTFRKVDGSKLTKEEYMAIESET